MANLAKPNARRVDRWSGGVTWICTLCYATRRDVFLYWPRLIHHLWVYHGFHMFTREEIDAGKVRHEDTHATRKLNR